MLKGLRQITERDRLAARVLELENENKRLKEQSRGHGPVFTEVARDFPAGNLPARVINHAVERLSPILSDDYARILSAVAHEHERNLKRFPDDGGGRMMLAHMNREDMHHRFSIDSVHVEFSSSMHEWDYHPAGPGRSSVL